MAASILPKPGTEVGPCISLCKHKDCAETRRMAEAECSCCGKPIGYDVRFYDLINPMGRAKGLTHFLCAVNEREPVKPKPATKLRKGKL